eukprot:GHVU01126459.1.p3 GENE.GHVU01126459.1~~GHVU01126459.1.p3  ORF type:complete len:152 (+),score=12.75 GHVU01126459.1:367-822(+)
MGGDSQSAPRQDKCPVIAFTTHHHVRLLFRVLRRPTSRPVRAPPACIHFNGWRGGCAYVRAYVRTRVCVCVCVCVGEQEGADEMEARHVRSRNGDASRSGISSSTNASCSASTTSPSPPKRRVHRRKRAYGLPCTWARVSVDVEMRNRESK